MLNFFAEGSIPIRPNFLLLAKKFKKVPSFDPISKILDPFLMIFVFIWFRATFPRLRVDQIMDLAWKGLFELTLINILAIAILMLIWPSPTIGELWIMTGINWLVFLSSIWIFGKLLGPKLEKKNGVTRIIVLQK